MYGENSVEIMVYDMERNPKKREVRKIEKKKSLRNITEKGKVLGD